MDGAAHELLRGAALVDVGGVPEGDTQLDGLPEERRSGILVQGPLVHPSRGLPVAHASQTDAADLQTRSAQTRVLHLTNLLR